MTQPTSPVLPRKYSHYKDLTDPRYLNMYLAFLKISTKAKDPAFKNLWLTKCQQVLDLVQKEGLSNA
jgi:hypothetical protein